MGSVIWEGYCALCRMVCKAGLSSASSATRLPVLVLRSKRGTWLLETSTLIRCPALKTLLVAHRSIVSTRPARLHQAWGGCGVAVAGADNAVGAREALWQRPLVSLRDEPHGCIPVVPG